MPINPQALDAMMDFPLVAAARDAYQEHCARQDAHAATIQAAREKLELAVSTRGGLLMNAARGEAVTAEETSTAEKMVRDAEAHLRFASDLSTSLEARRVELQSALTMAQGLAARPIVEHGAARRLDAAKRIDQAKADLAAAEADYATANEIVTHAVGRGYPFNAGLHNEFRSPVVGRGQMLDAATERRLWQAFGIDLSPAPAAAAE